MNIECGTVIGQTGSSLRKFGEVTLLPVKSQKLNTFTLDIAANLKGMYLQIMLVTDISALTDINYLY